MYLAHGKDISALEDMLYLAASLATCSFDTLLSPAAMEDRICGIPHFGTFRSKEIWLDAFHELLQNGSRYSLDSSQQAQIRSEMLRAGDLGPGPRRLVRWVAGACVSKNPFTKAEVREYKELVGHMAQHFAQRFGVEGRMQVYFQIPRGVQRHHGLVHWPWHRIYTVHRACGVAQSCFRF